MTRSGLIVGLVMCLAAVTAGAESRIKWTIDEQSIVAEHGRNKLVVQRRALVRFSALEGLASEIEHSLPPQSAPIRLYRTDPPELVEYVLGVTSEGRLLVGRQHHVLTLPERKYVFDRGEMGRSRSTLEQPGPWTWQLVIPLSREAQVTLSIKADRDRWPVETVTIDVQGKP
jgi:hypothetical protein